MPEWGPLAPLASAYLISPAEVNFSSLRDWLRRRAQAPDSRPYRKSTDGPTEAESDVCQFRIRVDINHFNIISLKLSAVVA